MNMETDARMILPELNDLRLSPHFTLSEMAKTSVKGVGNVPPKEAVENPESSG